MTRLEIGSTAPAFTLVAADGSAVSLADYAGRTVIVYFYPAAMTPGCTVQAVDFEANLADFEQAGYALVGISPDTPERLAAFADRESLGFALLADPDRTTIQAYGAWGTRKLYGKEVTGVIRSTFVVALDESGRGTIEVAQYNVRASGHVDKLRRDLGI